MAGAFVEVKGADSDGAGVGEQPAPSQPKTLIARNTGQAELHAKALTRFQAGISRAIMPGSLSRILLFVN